MDDDLTFRSSSSSPSTDPEDNAAAASSPTSAGGDVGGAAPSSPKKGRRAVQKRVVSFPIGAGAGVDGAPPPTDKWAWRKYGQKPIKGSPYPRGYYRCSSSKGCPARKQVERSREEPNMLVVTYSSDHNHSSSSFSSQRSKHHQPPPPAPAAAPPPADSGVDSNFANLIGGEFCWFSSTATPDDTLLYGSIADVAMMYGAADELIGGEKREEEEEDAALFAGLGELPECSVVFRRGFLGGGSGSRIAMDHRPGSSASSAGTV